MSGFRALRGFVSILVFGFSDLCWSDFLTCQEVDTIWSSNIKSRIRPLALHPMLALHLPPVKGKYPPVLPHKLRLGFTGCGCPGPGSSWGNPAVPPASKEAESPSIFSMWILCGGGRSCVRRPCREDPHRHDQKLG